MVPAVDLSAAECVEARIWTALRTVEDPEIPVSVVGMGLIVGVGEMVGLTVIVGLTEKVRLIVGVGVMVGLTVMLGLAEKVGVMVAVAAQTGPILVILNGRGILMPPTS